MAAIGRAGRTSAPKGSNILGNTSGSETLSRDSQAFPTQSTGPMNVSRANKRSRVISGPSYSSAKDLEYKGT